jgi:hypothetical protein
LVVLVVRDFFLSLPAATYLCASMTIMQRAMRGLVNSPCDNLRWLTWGNRWITYLCGKMLAVGEGSFARAFRLSVHALG